MQTIVISAVLRWKNKQNKIKMYMLVQIFLKQPLLFQFSLQKDWIHRFLSQEPFKRYCLSAYLSKTKIDLFKESWNEQYFLPHLEILSNLIEDKNVFVKKLYCLVSTVFLLKDNLLYSKNYTTCSQKDVNLFSVLQTIYTLNWKELIHLLYI